MRDLEYLPLPVALSVLMCLTFLTACGGGTDRGAHISRMATCVFGRSCPTLRTVDLQASLYVGFPRQEYWSGLPCPPQRGLPHTGIEPRSPVLAGGFFTIEPLGNPVRMTDLEHKEIKELSGDHMLDHWRQPGFISFYILRFNFDSA